MNNGYYIGLMTGTSIDAVDAVLVHIENKPNNDDNTTLKGYYSQPIPDSLKQRILELCQPGNNEIEKAQTLSQELAHTYVDCIEQLLQQHALDANAIQAIGSHGQTIRHHPKQEFGFSYQIGNPSTIAFLSGITTVADFRAKDIAAGGQGAPLVPAFHNAIFRSSVNRLIINIGGMANITFLPGNPARNISGFDTGPGNVLMDSWIHNISGKHYDKNGAWAESGHIIPELLSTLLDDEFIRQTPPKSTGRERYNLDSLTNTLQQFAAHLPQDIQRTLLEFTVQSIIHGIKQLNISDDDETEIYICGGGARNTFLLNQLQACMTPFAVSTTDTLGIPPEMVEGAAFAWLAYRTLNRKPGNLTRVTGATRDCILGGIYFP